MKRSIAALALISAGALMGCDSGTTTSASGEPAKSGAASSGAAKGSAAPAGGSAAAAGGGTAKPAEATPPASGGGILSHMPKNCDEGRAYVNTGKLLGGGAGGALEGLMAKGMTMSKDGKKSEEVLKIMKDGGIEPLTAMKEIAVCTTKDNKNMVIVAGVDFSKADKPADVIAKAIETGSGKAPKREEGGGASWLMEDGGKSVIAIVGKEKVLIGEDKATLEAAIKGGDGAGEFGDATSHVIWAKYVKDDITVQMKEAGGDYDLKVVTKTTKGAKIKQDFDKTLPEIDKMAEGKMAFIKPLLPAVKNAKLDVQGDMLTVTTKFPTKAIADFLTGMKDMKPEDLKGLPF